MGEGQWLKVSLSEEQWLLTAASVCSPLKQLPCFVWQAVWTHTRIASNGSTLNQKSKFIDYVPVTKRFGILPPSIPKKKPYHSKPKLSKDTWVQAVWGYRFTSSNRADRKVSHHSNLWLWSLRKCSDLFYASANNFLTSVPRFCERGCLNSGSVGSGGWGRKEGREALSQISGKHTVSWKGSLEQSSHFTQHLGLMN